MFGRDSRVLNFAFSNFQRVPISFGGLVYPSIEHAYQAAKTTDTRLREQIRHAGTAGRAKKIGRTVTLRPHWDEDKVEVMRALLRLKFTTGSFHYNQLKATVHEIVEWNDWHDTFWGKCVCTKHNDAGENMLGRLLMEIRDAN